MQTAYVIVVPSKIPDIISTLHAGTKTINTGSFVYGNSFSKMIIWHSSAHTYHKISIRIQKVYLDIQKPEKHSLSEILDETLNRGPISI